MKHKVITRLPSGYLKKVNADKSNYFEVPFGENDKPTEALGDYHRHNHLSCHATKGHDNKSILKQIHAFFDNPYLENQSIARGGQARIADLTQIFYGHQYQGSQIRPIADIQYSRYKKCKEENVFKHEIVMFCYAMTITDKVTRKDKVYCLNKDNELQEISKGAHHLLSSLSDQVQQYIEFNPIPIFSKDNTESEESILGPLSLLYIMEYNITKQFNETLKNTKKTEKNKEALEELQKLMPVKPVIYGADFTTLHGDEKNLKQLDNGKKAATIKQNGMFVVTGRGDIRPNHELHQEIQKNNNIGQQILQQDAIMKAKHWLGEFKKFEKQQENPSPIAENKSALHRFFHSIVNYFKKLKTHFSKNNNQNKENIQPSASNGNIQFPMSRNNAGFWDEAYEELNERHSNEDFWEQSNCSRLR